MLKLSYILFPFLLLLVGCATGRGPAGEVIIGVEVGTLTDTANQALGAGINMFAPGLGTIIAGGLASIGGVAGLSKLVVNKIEKRRKAADMAREVAERALAVAETKLETPSA